MEKLRTKNSEYWIGDNIIMAKIWGDLDKEEIQAQDKIAMELFKKIQRTSSQIFYKLTERFI